MENAAFAPLIQDLCAFTTGVVAPGNEGLFARLGQELPLTVHRYPSGATYNGWIVPALWSVDKARIMREGKLVFDGLANPLAVATYAKSFCGELDWEALRPRLVTNPEQPEAYVYHCMWQYRPWDADWALSIPYEIFQSFGPGRYRVELETAYQPGEMLVGEYEHKGRSPLTFVFNAHTCHPHMANDDMAGVALLVRLFQWLKGQDTYYSYRLVLGPEHLGTVFYLREREPEDIERLVGGVFAEMPGTDFPLKLQASFRGGQLIDRAVGHAMRHCGEAFVHVPWRKGAGNDETVWEAPGYEVPFVELSRCGDQFDPYPEYHTSLDTPESLRLDRVESFFRVLLETVRILEHDATLHRAFNGLICLSNPRYDLYFERPDPAVAKNLVFDSEKWGALLDSLFRYFDGDMTVLDIAERHDVPFWPLFQYVRKFEQKGLLTMRFAPATRIAPRRVEEPLAPD